MFEDFSEFIKLEFVMDGYKRIKIIQKKIQSQKSL